MKPIEVRCVGVTLTADVGANDSLLYVRVVPASREGNKVFGRTLIHGEKDNGDPICFYPYAGEELHFPAGSIRVHIQDIDRLSLSKEDGYSSLSNTIWTWLSVGAPPNPDFFRFLFSAARRLDTAQTLYVEVMANLVERPQNFIAARQRFFDALGLVELLCVALGRAVDMLQAIPDKFGVQINIPSPVSSKFSALREIRNAVEHIEDRAFGNVRGKPHPDALSIFNQSDFLSHAILRYASHALDMRNDVLPILLGTRRVLFDVVVAKAGEAITLNSPIIFPAAPPGAHLRIEERAYYLWKNSTGCNWQDSDANWFEAERAESQDHKFRQKSPPAHSS